METNNKLREALEFSIRQMSNAICDNTFGDDVVYLVGCMKTCIDRMKSALAAPPRNCDVGTAEEQYERHSKWCANERSKDCAATMCRKCLAEFMNKPYKQEGCAK